MSWRNAEGIESMLKLKSGLCRVCWNLAPPSTEDDSKIIALRKAGWQWCPIREDYIHESMGCDEWKRIPKEVRLGLPRKERAVTSLDT